MEIETAPIINDRESSVVWESSPRKKQKPNNSGKSTEKQVSEDDFGEWVDEETVRMRIEELNKKYDDFGFIDDEKLRDAARAYHQRRIDNPFDIDDLPPSPLPSEKIWPLKSSSWMWERAKELLHYAVKTEQEKKGWNLCDLNLVKANKLQRHYYITFEAKHDQGNSTYQTTICDNVFPCGGSINVEIFRRKGEGSADDPMAYGFRTNSFLKLQSLYETFVINSLLVYLFP